MKRSNPLFRTNNNSVVTCTFDLLKMHLSPIFFVLIFSYFSDLSESAAVSVSYTTGSSWSTGSTLTFVFTNSGSSNVCAVTFSMTLPSGVRGFRAIDNSSNFLLGLLGFFLLIICFRNFSATMNTKIIPL